MKKVLIITYYWPPSGGSGVQRWLKFAKYLPQEGVLPIIYTPANPSAGCTDPSLAKDIPFEATVLKTPIREPYDIYRRFLGRKGSSGNDVNPINNSGRKSFKEKLSLWVRANLFIPDPRIFWVRPSVKYLVEYLKSNPVDAIISTGPPHSMHLIAMKVARRTGTKWIADFRDPWTRIYSFESLPMCKPALRKHRRLERRVMRRADAVVSVTNHFCLDIREIAPKQRVVCITNGYDVADYAPYIDASLTLDRKFTITHTGAFYVDFNPAPLWKALEDLCCEEPGFREDLSIRLAGRTDRGVIDDIQNHSLPYTDYGYLSHDEVIRMQLSSRVLLLPTKRCAEMKKILHGKIFEYMCTGRPVVSIGDKGSEVEGILEGLGIGRQFDWDDTEGLKAHIKMLWQLYRAVPDASIELKFHPEYSRESLTREYVHLIDTL